MKRWLALCGCFIGMAVSVSSTLLFPFGLFMAPLTTEFGWTRTEFSSVLAVVALCNVVVFPIAGWAVDRIGPIPCILAGLLVSGLCQAALALVHGYGAFVTFDCAASAAGCFALYPAYFAIVRGWFDRNLGVALAVASAGVSVGVAAFSYLIKARIDAAGWRDAFVTVAAVATAIGLANLLLLVRENKGPMLASERLSVSEGPILGASLQEALRTPEYWLFSISFMLVVFVGAGPNTHLPALIADRGGSSGSVVAAVAAIPIGSLIGRIITGLLLDRFPATFAATLFFAGQAIGLLMLWAGTGWTAVATLLIGMAQGAELDMMGFVMARRFGRRSYARIFGSSAAISQLGLIASPVVMATIFDRTQSYSLALLCYPILSLVAIFLIVRASQAVVGQPVLQQR